MATQTKGSKASTKALENRKAATRKSQAVADGYAAGTREAPPENLTELPLDATPLDVMVMAMRRAFLIGGSMLAAGYAEKAAPYMHGKIQTIELKNGRPGAPGSDGGKPMPFQIEFVDPKPQE